MLTAQSIMTEELVTIHPEASVEAAIDVLLKERISGLPVVNSEGQLVGIVTEFALLAVAYDQHIRHDTVAQHMTTDVFTIESDAPINKVADLCIMHRVRRIPVLEEGRLIGKLAAITHLLGGVEKLWQAIGNVHHPL